MRSAISRSSCEFRGTRSRNTAGKMRDALSCSTLCLSSSASKREILIRGTSNGHHRLVDTADVAPGRVGRGLDLLRRASLPSNAHAAPNRLTTPARSSPAGAPVARIAAALRGAENRFGDVLRAGSRWKRDGSLSRPDTTHTRPQRRSEEPAIPAETRKRPAAARSRSLLVMKGSPVRVRASAWPSRAVSVDSASSRSR